MPLFPLLFVIVYPVLMILAWSMGMFGLAVSMPDIRIAAERRASYRYEIPGTITLLVWRQIAITFLTGLLWPVGLPMWFAWRKGTFVANELVKRDLILNAKD